MNQPQITGMRAFTLIWFGQLISFIGTGMTRFVLPIYVWQETERATGVALLMLFGFAPEILLSPIAGALVDRWNRKYVMMLTDIAAGSVTIMFLLLYRADSLDIWHLYLGGAIIGAFQSFQFPAYSAAISTLIPPEQYTRASGMMALADSGSGILAPILAGALVGVIGVDGIMTIDVVTFLFAVGALLLVHIPQPQISAEGQASKGSLLQESVYGFHYIRERKPLLGLQMVFFVINFVAMFGVTVTVPMILARTGNDQFILGAIQSIGGIGGVIGGLLLSTWGGPKRRIYGVLGGMFAISLFGEIVMGIGQSLLIWAFAAFMTSLFLPMLNGSNQAIWQAKVPPDIQGRVFAARRLIAQVTIPLSIAISGPLADYVFEPSMQPDGALANLFGWLVGTGNGAGMGLMFVIAGVLGMLTAAIAYQIDFIRNVETIMPDHQQAPQPAEVAEPGIEPTEHLVTNGASHKENSAIRSLKGSASSEADGKGLHRG